MTNEAEYLETGARWRALLFVPIFCGIGIAAEVWMGGPVHWLGWTIAAVLLGGVVAWQVSAARTHLRVELTRIYLRQGAETLDLSEIAELLPEPEADPKCAETWQAARALGELHGVPRKRTGIGLRLRSGQLVQAWARDHTTLRSALHRLLVTP